MTAQSRFSRADKLRVIVFLASRVRMLLLDSSTSIRLGLCVREENQPTGLNLDDSAGVELTASAGAADEVLAVPFMSAGSVAVVEAGTRWK